MTQDDIKSRVLNLKDFVTYAEGSVVSKTLIDKPVGTLTLFSFSEGQGLSEHTAPYDAVVHILDGTAEITIDGTLLLAEEGQMVIMPANHPHALKAIKPFKMMLIMIRAS